MKDHYPLVLLNTDPDSRACGQWWETPDGQSKVVPADAIVIERGDLPEVETRADLTARAGHLDISLRAESWIEKTSTRDSRRRVDVMRERALDYLAAAEYLAEHPPLDEAQVAAMDADLDQIIGDVGHNSPELAARLIAQGWTKPVTP